MATSGKELFVTRRCFMQGPFHKTWRENVAHARSWRGGALLLALLTLACPSAPPRRSIADAPAAPLASITPRDHIGFASRQKLVEHYEKHGREFGAINQAEYLRQAQALRDRPAGGEVLEMVRADGVITRFDRATGAFLAYNPNAIIRTYFKPNDGEAYFRRQSKRAAR